MAGGASACKEANRAWGFPPRPLPPLHPAAAAAATSPSMAALLVADRLIFNQYVFNGHLSLFGQLCSFQHQQAPPLIEYEPMPKRRKFSAEAADDSEASAKRTKLDKPPGRISFRPHCDVGNTAASERHDRDTRNSGSGDKRRSTSKLLQKPEYSRNRKRAAGPFVARRLESGASMISGVAGAAGRRGAVEIECIELLSDDDDEDDDEVTVCPTSQSEPLGNSTNISHVFPELLSMIFGYLDLPSKGRAAQVCSRWRDACYQKSVWRGTEAKLHLKSAKSNSTLYPSLVRRGIRKVQVLSLKKSLRELTHAMPELESLNMSGCYNLSDSTLDSAFYRSMPKLKTLNLSLCKEISDHSLHSISKQCSELRLLNLAGCNRVTNKGLCAIANKLTELESLSLRSCKLITGVGISHLMGSPSASTKGTKKLKELCLQDCQRLADDSLHHLADGLPELQQLNLSFCASVTDTGLKSLAAIRSLRELNLRSCDNISDIGIGFLAETENGLQKLDVSFCNNVTDAALKHIANGLRLLDTLEMSNCLISDEGLIRVAKNLKKLKCLNVGQCNLVSDASLKIVVEELSSTLQEVDLYGCAKVSKEVMQMIRKMPKMSEVNLALHMAV